jgi:hypothetical protein
MKNYEKESFQTKIINEYTYLKRMVDSLSDYSKNPYGRFINDIKGPKSLKQCAKSTFFRIAAFVEHLSVAQFVKTPDYLKYVEKSKEIISNPEIKKSLCPLFRSEIGSDLLEEEKTIKIIKILTTVLLDKKNSSKFSFDLDSRLFAFITLEIQKEGINNYCYQEN